MARGSALFPELLFAVLVGSVVLRGIFGRTLGSAFTGAGAGLLVLLAGYALALAGVAALGAFLLTLLMGAAGARQRLVELAPAAAWGRLGRTRRRPGWGWPRRRGFRRRRGRRLRWRWRLGWLVRSRRDEVRPSHTPSVQHALEYAPAFSRPVLDAIEQAIGECEGRHGGEIRFVVETAFDLPELWRGLAPRQRALQLFGQFGVWDTAHNNGVLIYVLMADHAVEIVADRGIAQHVSPAEWDAVCRQMEAHFRAGRFREGSLVGILRRRGVARPALSRPSQQRQRAAESAGAAVAAPPTMGAARDIGHNPSPMKTSADPRCRRRAFVSHPRSCSLFGQRERPRRRAAAAAAAPPKPRRSPRALRTGARPGRRRRRADREAARKTRSPTSRAASTSATRRSCAPIRKSIPGCPGDGPRSWCPSQFILPNAPRTGVVINIAAMRIFYFPPHKKGRAAGRVHPSHRHRQGRLAHARRGHQDRAPPEGSHLARAGFGAQGTPRERRGARAGDRPRAPTIRSASTPSTCNGRAI